MRIVLKHLLLEFCKYFFSILLGFLALVLILKGQEIAQFAAIDNDFRLIGKLFLNQLPDLFPLAIPLASMTSCYLLIKKLSENYELTALRSAGYSFLSIVYPLLAVGLILGFLNFYIVSEYRPLSKLQATFLPYQYAKENPLALIKNPKLFHIEKAHVEGNYNEKNKCLDHVLLASKSDPQGPISLIYFRSLKASNKKIYGQSTSYILPLKNDNFRENLMIEYVKQFEFDSEDFSNFAIKPFSKIKFECLNTKNCLMRLKGEKETKNILRIKQILFKRLFFLLAPLAFTVLGLAYGLTNVRKTSSWPLISMIFIASLIFTSYLAGKSLKNIPILCLSLYTLPSLVAILIASLKIQRFLKRGI